MKRLPPLMWVVGLIGLLVLTGLACAQAGEIVSPEEATRQAEEAASGAIFSGGGETIEGAALQPGDKAKLVGTSFIINLFSGPGGRIVAGQERDTEVDVIDVTQDGDRLWYKVDAPTGEGWVTELSIEKIETGETDEAGEDAGPAPGDTVFLVGARQIVNILDRPNGFIVAGDARNTQVVIVETFDEEGVRWYRVDAPGGEGWVPEENISVEQPE